MSNRKIFIQSAVIDSIIRYFFPFPESIGYSLLHRYSFNVGTTSDSVGGPVYAGSLMAGATVTHNQANFTIAGSFLNLPSGLFGSYTALSVEAWVTTGTNSNSGWARIFQFGAAATLNKDTLVVFT